MVVKFGFNSRPADIDDIQEDTVSQAAPAAYLVHFFLMVIVHT